MSSIRSLWWKFDYFFPIASLISLMETRVKKRVSESHAKSRAYNPIQDSGETLDKRDKSRQESCRESHQECSQDSLRDYRWDFWRDSWQDFSPSPSVSPESRIGLYAWLSARLFPRLVFLRGKRIRALKSPC